MASANFAPETKAVPLVCLKAKIEEKLIKNVLLLLHQKPFLPIFENKII